MEGIGTGQTIDMFAGSFACHVEQDLGGRRNSSFCELHVTFYAYQGTSADPAAPSGSYRIRYKDGTVQCDIAATESHSSCQEPDICSSGCPATCNPTHT